MHETHPFLLTLAVVLGVAAVTTVLFQRLRQPVIFGYLIAGMIVGPHVPIPIVVDQGIVQALAELGVVLLMFSLGLEFTLKRLSQVGPVAGIVALLQSSLMIFLGYGAARLFGWTPLECIYTGAIIAISSTTIIIKAFRENNVQGPVTDIVFGVLIIEDLIAIVLLAILTPVSLGRELSAGALLITVGRLVAFLAALLVTGLLLVPRTMRFIIRLDRPETTLVACIGICFGCAILAQRLGYSVALGAFLAGMLVAESGEQSSIERLIEPVRDMFAAIFFVAVGMLIHPQLVAKHWLAVVVFTGLVVVGKVGAVAISVFIAGGGIRTAVQAGMSLAQIGEFSFIIASVGASTGATGAFLYPVAVAVSAATTLLTPWLIRFGPWISEYVDRHLPRRIQTFAALYGSWIENLRKEPAADRRPAENALRWLVIDILVVAAIIMGVSLEKGPLTNLVRTTTGLAPEPARMVLLLAAILAAAPFVLGMIRTARTFGQTLAARTFPDPPSGRLDLAAAPRRAMVTTIQLATALIAGVPLAALSQLLVPTPYALGVLVLMVFVLGFFFWQSATDLSGHARAGAEVIVAAISKQSRGDADAARGLDQAYALAPGLGRPVPVQIMADDPAIGKSLGHLRIRGRTGATVLAIVRGNQVILVPDGHEILRAGDILALTGTSDSVEAARDLLGPPKPGGA